MLVSKFGTLRLWHSNFILCIPCSKLVSFQFTCFIITKLEGRHVPESLKSPIELYHELLKLLIFLSRNQAIHLKFMY